MEQIKPVGETTKKQIMVGGAIALVLILVGIIFYINGGASIGGLLQKGGAGSCLVLAQEYCDVARMVKVDAQGTMAAAFQLPVGTPIYMPFDGMFTDGTAGQPVSEVIQLSIPNTESVVTMVGAYTPSVVSGASVAKGKQFAATATGAGEASAFNLVVYTQNYELTNLFPLGE